LNEDVDVVDMTLMGDDELRVKTEPVEMYDAADDDAAPAMTDCQSGKTSVDSKCYFCAAQHLNSAIKQLEERVNIGRYRRRRRRFQRRQLGPLTALRGSSSPLWRFEPTRG